MSRFTTLSPGMRAAMLTPTGSNVRYEPTYAFEFSKPRGRIKGTIARFAWRMLGRLGALLPYSQRVETFTYTEADRDSLMQRFGSHFGNWIDRGNDPSNAVLIVGTEDMMDLRANVALMVGRWSQNSIQGYYRYHYDGIPIHVVPGMQGWAFVPRILIEKEVPKDDPLPQAKVQREDLDEAMRKWRDRQDALGWNGGRAAD